MCSHVPNRGEQMVCYYGYYGNVLRGKRKKEGQDDALPCVIEENDISPEQLDRLPGLGLAQPGQRARARRQGS